MTDSRFRLLMLASLGLLILGVAAELGVLYGGQVPVPTDGPAWSTAASVGAALSFLRLLLFGAGFVGLYFFKPWGRTLSLLVAMAFPLLGTASSFAFGNTIDLLPSAVVAGAAASLSELAWGAVLALAYYSPLNLRFSADNSFKPKPLRGSA
ncbi:MAG TPA: hypothetical protein VFP00_12165 [Burkholderiales bacterium]|nr:hypothetical protein [Burkholderiales bacterium]